MDPAITEAVARIDSQHWLYRYRARLVLRTLQGLGLEDRKNLNILDVGCGSGGSTLQLSRFGHVTALDLSPAAVACMAERAPGMQCVEGDLHKLDTYFEPHGFDLVTCFHVLYHQNVVDDAHALGQLAAQVRPGGYLLLEEPADMRLRRYMDRIDQGARRFELPTLAEQVSNSGLEICEARYLHAWAWPAARLLALIDAFSRARQQKLPVELRVGWFNYPAQLFSRIETGLGFLGVTMPFGTACWIVAHRSAVKNSI